MENTYYTMVRYNTASKLLTNEASGFKATNMKAIIVTRLVTEMNRIFISLYRTTTGTFTVQFFIANQSNSTITFIADTL